ncbi:UNVERIFIED_CONTAM: hypothetical protein Sradi_0935700 [Sesamum radiatum]|uniref:Uncharacterized protein n=1 Tax=Sesamum radiatum TaxID=300843 RepID=A0AAW2V3J8_SESRA
MGGSTDASYFIDEFFPIAVTVDQNLDSNGAAVGQHSLVDATVSSSPKLILEGFGYFLNFGVFVSLWSERSMLQ